MHSLERLVDPRDILVSIKQRPHVMASGLATDIGAEVASGVPIIQKILRIGTAAFVPKTNLSESSVFTRLFCGVVLQPALGLTKGSLNLATDAVRSIKRNQCQCGEGLCLVVRQRGSAAECVDERQTGSGHIKGEVIGSGTLQWTLHDHSPDRTDDSFGYNGYRIGEHSARVLVLQLALTDISIAVHDDGPRLILHYTGIESYSEPHIRGSRNADDGFVGGGVECDIEVDQGGGIALRLSYADTAVGISGSRRFIEVSLSDTVHLRRTRELVKWTNDEKGSCMRLNDKQWVCSKYIHALKHAYTHANYENLSSNHDYVCLPHHNKNNNNNRSTHGTETK